MARKNRSAEKGAAMREQSQRQLRVGELVRHALSEIILREDLHDKDLAGVTITITEVRMTPDLKRATCYVMPLGGDNPQIVVKALARVAPRLSHEIGRRVKLKFTPRLLFRADSTFAEAERVDQILRSPKVAADLNADEQNEVVDDGA